MPEDVCRQGLPGDPAAGCKRPARPPPPDGRALRGPLGRPLRPGDSPLGTPAPLPRGGRRRREEGRPGGRVRRNRPHVGPRPEADRRRRGRDRARPLRRRPRGNDVRPGAGRPRAPNGPREGPHRRGDPCRAALPAGARGIPARAEAGRDRARQGGGGPRVLPDGLRGGPRHEAHRPRAGPERARQAGDRRRGAHAARAEGRRLRRWREPEGAKEVPDGRHPLARDDPGAPSRPRSAPRRGPSLRRRRRPDPRRGAGHRRAGHLPGPAADLAGRVDRPGRPAGREGVAAHGVPRLRGGDGGRPLRSPPRDVRPRRGPSRRDGRGSRIPVRPASPSPISRPPGRHGPSGGTSSSRSGSRASWPPSTRRRSAP